MPLRGSPFRCFSCNSRSSIKHWLAGAAVAGAVGSATGGAVQGIGNAAYFGDAYSARDWISGIGIGAVTGGIGGTISAKFQGKHWLNGTRDGTGIAPNFGNSKWLKTNDGWKLSSAKGGDLTFQGVDGVGSLGGRNVGDVVGSNLPTTYYPPNNGAAGNWTSTYLRPGQIIDRYGGPGRFFSSAETAAGARSLPYNSNTNLYTKYEVLKPFQVQTSRIAPAFGEIGGGTQYLSPITSDILLKRGIIRIVR